ncbi:MAG: DNA methyltransferase [Finegoldia sp.]|nr:DNA methyltransferase [Finegoldia sp.]
MKQIKNKVAAKNFAKKWKGIGYEKGDSQRFWLSLLNEVYGVEYPAEFIRFEDQVALDHTSFIDGYIPSTHVLIEQKSIDKDLRKPIKQSDGSFLSPFQQAKRYSIELPYDERPRWIVLSNFAEFHIFDMNKPQAEPEIVYLKDLEEDYYRLNFLVDTKEKEIQKSLEVSIKAGELVGILYDNLLKKYIDPQDPKVLQDLNILCVRLVFCFYAEDAYLFGKKNMFYDYLKTFKDSPEAFRNALIQVFKILDEDESSRDPYLSDELLAFPYVNGGLFAKEDLVIPRLDEEIIDIILNQASSGFDWSKISPTIFGSLFESTLNPDTRRAGGMHYTSLENIHKVIDPLFLDELKEEFNEIMEIKTINVRKKKLEALQDKIASLVFLDPACGSGNFLTETYICLRKLENQILKELYGNQIMLGAVHNPIKVSIGQFYGIEINDFAVSVARAALWIAESQMMNQTEEIINMDLDFFPLKSYPNIAEENALTYDWNNLVKAEDVSYIMGNPPFVGAMLMSKSQTNEIKNLYESIKGSGEIDYVTGWYLKSAEMMEKNPNIISALVSTNSISQGQQPGIYWRYISQRYNLEIVFAHQTFKWNSEAKLKAAVHVVIIAFANKNNPNVKYKYIFTDKMALKVNNINSYLLDAEDVFIENRKDPICQVSPMNFGNMPRDGGNFILDENEKDALIKSEPISKNWIHLYLGANEFINNKKRYCLWLTDADPSEIKSSPTVMKRVEGVKNFRLSSKAKSTQKMADSPTLFAQRTQQVGKPFIMVPATSSERRKYIPIGFLDGDVIASNGALIITDATIYEFGILTSNVHMAWMRVVGGRLKSDYRYSKNIVYNNFPWPDPDQKQREKIEGTAQAILDARDIYPYSSLADLYDDLTMPKELRKAHQENDRAVMEAYGFDWHKMTESECVAELMKMYKDMTSDK